MIRITDHPNMSSAVYCECYRKIQTNKAILGEKMYSDTDLYYLCSENKGADQLRGYRTHRPMISGEQRSSNRRPTHRLLALLFFLILILMP